CKGTTASASQYLQVPTSSSGPCFGCFQSESPARAYASAASSAESDQEHFEHMTSPSPSRSLRSPQLGQVTRLDFGRRKRGAERGGKAILMPRTSSRVSSNSSRSFRSGSSGAGPLSCLIASRPVLSLARDMQKAVF